jgi:competence protein ComEA
MLSRPGAADPEVARRRLQMLAAELGDDDVGRSAAPPQGRGRHSAHSLSARSRLLTRVADALPPAVKGRWGITAHHVTVVALVVATVLALAAWWAMRARPEPVTALPVTESVGTPASGTPAAPSASTATASASASPSAPPVVVHVAGSVRRPGIVTLPAGSRVVDALQAAGGSRKGTDLASLNLARPLADGEQILVGTGVPAAPSVAGTPGAPTADGSAAGGVLVNLNTATSAELEELPGIGPVTAASILQWRTEHGRFTSVEELLEVSGIGEARLADVRDLVTV